MDFNLINVLDPTRVISAIGFGLVSSALLLYLTGRLEEMKFRGMFALGAFLAGLSAAASGSYGSATLQAGVAAFNAYGWWTSGGEQQFARLLRQLDSDRS